MAAQKFKQGYYVPKHPEKYIGDVNKIVYRSSWEYKMDEFLDNNPNVLQWASESIAVPYVKPTDGKIHKYYPDYYVKYRNKQGEIIEEILEVKPQKQTRRSRTRNPKNKLFEDIQFAINVAKWKYCQEFCNKHNIKFRLVTENTLFR